MTTTSDFKRLKTVRDEPHIGSTTSVHGHRGVSNLLLHGDLADALPGDLQALAATSGHPPLPGGDVRCACSLPSPLLAVKM
jgi:hypothetical protein